jgi:hypothetical protein
LQPVQEDRGRCEQAGGGEDSVQRTAGRKVWHDNLDTAKADLAEKTDAVDILATAVAVGTVGGRVLKNVTVNIGNSELVSADN